MDEWIWFVLGAIVALAIYGIVKGLLIFGKAGADFGHKMPKETKKEKRLQRKMQSQSGTIMIYGGIAIVILLIICFTIIALQRTQAEFSCEGNLDELTGKFKYLRDSIDSNRSDTGDFVIEDVMVNCRGYIDTNALRW